MVLDRYINYFIINCRLDFLVFNHFLKMARQSTDEKLRDIINGPDDEENYEQILRAEKAAKNNLRRTSLYGAGARAKIPKVKVIMYIFILLLC